VIALPESVATRVAATLGDAIAAAESLGTGHGVSRARVTTRDGRFLIKWSAESAAPAGWPSPLDAEARGLRLLADADALRVPAVIASVASEHGSPHLLISEWIESSSRASRDAAVEALGAGLAALHRRIGPQYGLDHHNFCGATPQRNTPHDSWLAFWRDERLGFQADLAARRGLLPPERRRRLDRLMSRLDHWIDDSQARPSLTHGDLWGGNWLVDERGAPVLIDPAACYADRESELAMCALFGGFPEAFWRSYSDSWPLAPGAADRRPLYQLYHLLNHLNLFGEGYGGQVDAILRRYAG
jgi:fructosamine-3-kinase